MKIAKECLDDLRGIKPTDNYALKMIELSLLRPRLKYIRDQCLFEDMDVKTSQRLICEELEELCE